jgi:hypothetical protein
MQSTNTEATGVIAATALLARASTRYIATGEGTEGQEAAEGTPWRTLVKLPHCDGRGEGSMP